MSGEKLNKQPIKIIVDSNALFIPLELKLDIFYELRKLLNRNFELIILSPVKTELETLAQRSPPKMRRNAMFALELASKCTYVRVSEKSNEPTDEAIIRVAQAWKAPVFTNDKLLKRTLRDISIPVIYVRAKSRLEMDGLIS
ncbi:MAG TPA: ribonuclease VapC [Candidatus Nanoarchaeia archaeon]|nr:ribonuclease VapC [Candidatus Nanoarchaeia archaeon]